MIAIDALRFAWPRAAGDLLTIDALYIGAGSSMFRLGGLSDADACARTRCGWSPASPSRADWHTGPAVQRSPSHSSFAPVRNMPM